MKNNSDQKTTYIVTGASGHLGNVLVRKLLKRGEQVTGLLLPGEKPPACGMRTVYGNVCEKESLRPLFLSGTEAVVIHCAGCVSISSYDGLKLWNTNVLGTRNLVELAEEYNVAKFIYVSSVHALPEREKGQQITEIQDFDDTLVVGDYAKTKALATRCVLQEAASGFPACTVHPSGLIGPYDPGAGQMTRLLKLFLKGLLPATVAGGYDFADVRDVADGILSCCERGEPGESYILSGHYYSIREFLRDLKVEKQEPEKLIENSLEKNERLVYSVLDFTPKHLETLLADTGLALEELLKVLYRLSELGCAKEIHQNYYIKSKVDS